MGDKANISLADIHDLILVYIKQGKNLESVEVISDIDNKVENELYLDESEIVDNVFIIRN